MIISTNDGVCRKKQQYSPVIEEFDDGAILLIESSYPTMSIAAVIEKIYNELKFRRYDYVLFKWKL